MKFTLLLIITSSVFANTNTSINTTQTTPSSSFLDKLKPTRIGYFSDFIGPSLGNGDRVDEDGEVGEGSIKTWNQVSLGWKISDNLRFVINPRFGINHNPQDGKEFEFIDPVVGISGTWFKRGNLLIGGGINTIIPQLRTQSTKDKGRLFNPGGFQFVDYKINEKVSLGSWVWARVTFFDGTQKDDENRLSFFVAPLVTYSLNDNISFSTYYWIDGGQEKQNALRFSNTDKLGFMGSFKINKLLTVQPIISFFQRNGSDLSKANLNIWFSGRFF